MFPTRSAVTRMANIVVIPICADSESVYSDMMGMTVTTYQKRKSHVKKKWQSAVQDRQRPKKKFSAKVTLTTTSPIEILIHVNGRAFLFCGGQC